MNKLGTCSWTIGMTDLDDLMAKVKELGLDGLQFSGDGRTYQAQAVREAAAKYGLELFAIDPFDCAPEDPQTASTAAAVSYYKTYVIDFAAACGAGGVTLQGLTQWTKNCNSPEEARQRLIDCCRELSRYAEGKQLKLLFEVVNRYETPMIRTAAECRAVLKEAGSEAIQMVLDSFHMNIDETDACEAIRRNGDLLGGYHISDSNRAGIGSGHIDFAAQHRVLSATGFTGPVMIELVLPELTPTNTPGNMEERARLDEEIKRSARIWKAMF